MKISCLLFDLDGTLIESRDDLADSVNLMLSELKLANLPSQTIYNFIGEGVFNLVNRSISASFVLKELGHSCPNKRTAFEQESKAKSNLDLITASRLRLQPFGQECPSSDEGVEIFRKIYAENCLIKTKLYDGVKETLNKLSDFPKAVITNKPHDFSIKILEGLGIAQHFSLVVGGDSFPERKPSPVPLLGAIEKLGFSAEESLMIGDSWVDIETGKNANVKTCGCIFGFRGRDELEKARADFLIENFSDLLSLLNY